MKWAREVLDWSLGQTALMIKEHASNSYIEGEIKKVLKIIKQAGAKGITHSQLTRKCQKITKQTRDLTAINIQSINLVDRKDYYWDQYLADHTIKHSHYSRNRNFGYSKNLMVKREAYN